MKTKTRTVFTVYKSRKEFRWWAKRAGRIVADSGEGYKRRRACLRSLARFIASIEQRNYDIWWDET